MTVVICIIIQSKFIIKTKDVIQKNIKHYRPYDRSLRSIWKQLTFCLTLSKPLIELKCTWRVVCRGKAWEGWETLLCCPNVEKFCFCFFYWFFFFFGKNKQLMTWNPHSINFWINTDPFVQSKCTSIKLPLFYG